jgi:hypothetical protein
MKKFLVAVSMLSFASAASAANLANISGDVMINKGEGFVPAVSSVELSAGDKILVGEGGFVDVAYDKCTVSLAKPMVHSIAKVAPCDQAVISPVADLEAPFAAGFGGLPLPLILVGTAVVAGGGYLLVTKVLDDEDDAATR